MTTGLLQNLKRTTTDATHAIAARSDRSKAQMTTSEIAVAVVGVAAIAGIIAAAIHFTPDVIRYLKIERM